MNPSGELNAGPFATMNPFRFAIVAVLFVLALVAMPFDVTLAQFFIQGNTPGFVGAGQRTIFDSVTATFDVVDGQITNENLAFLSPLLNASGKGRLGLGSQDLDHRLLPVLLEGAGGSR